MESIVSSFLSVVATKSSEMSAKRGVDFLKSIAEYYGKTAGHDALTNVVCVAGCIRQLYLFYKTTPHVN